MLSIMMRRLRHALPAACLALAAACARAAGAQDPAALAAAAEALLREQAAPLGGQAAISVEPPPRAQALPACADAPSAFLSAGSRLRPRMSVGVRCASPAWTVYLQAAVSVQGDYYVARRSIGPGEPIGEDDVETRRGDLLGLAPGTALDMESLLGRIAGQRIAAGQPVRLRALRDADAVRRGNVVRILARGPGFVVASEGEAMGNGGPGASVRVRTAGGQVVSAIVQDAHTVEVPL